MVLSALARGPCQCRGDQNDITSNMNEKYAREKYTQVKLQMSEIESASPNPLRSFQLDRDKAVSASIAKFVPSILLFLTLR